MTKKQLIRYLKKNSACEPALIWLNEQETFGPELIKLCPDVDWLEWLGCRVNPAEYEVRVKPLWDEYKAKKKPLWDEYDAKKKPLWDEYRAKENPLWDEYDAKRKHLWDEYYAKEKSLRDEHEAKEKSLRDEYEAKMKMALLDILTWDKIEKAVAVGE